MEPASDCVGVGKSQEEPRGEDAMPRLSRFRISGCSPDIELEPGVGFRPEELGRSRLVLSRERSRSLQGVIRENKKAATGKAAKQKKEQKLISKLKRKLQTVHVHGHGHGRGHVRSGRDPRCLPQNLIWRPSGPSGGK